jgi:hypothetical protein
VADFGRREIFRGSGGEDFFSGGSVGRNDGAGGEFVEEEFCKVVGAGVVCAGLVLKQGGEVAVGADGVVGMEAGFGQGDGEAALGAVVGRGDGARGGQFAQERVQGEFFFGVQLRAGGGFFAEDFFAKLGAAQVAVGMAEQPDVKAGCGEVAGCDVGGVVDEADDGDGGGGVDGQGLFEDNKGFLGIFFGL